MPPSPDQIEISLFGPGYGETVLIHIGSGRWIIVDSCVERGNAEPLSLRYLRSIGVDPKTSVDLVIITHWHDDHIRGASATLEACVSAQFSCSNALQQTEFLAMVRAYEKNNALAVGNGVKEINQIIAILNERRITPKYAAPNRILMRRPGKEFAHGKDCLIWSLSPSDSQFSKFLRDIAVLMPESKVTKSRCPSTGSNHAATVVLIQIGDEQLLLGSDLEETGDPQEGWSVIVSSVDRPPGHASVFKIPHHGSISGHHGPVWAEMLSPQPYAILTPWRLAGRSLPTAEDIARIERLTPNMYSTGNSTTASAKRRTKVVEKTIKEIGARIRTANPVMGHIRLRSNPLDSTNWNIEKLETTVA